MTDPGVVDRLTEEALSGDITVARTRLFDAITAQSRTALIEALALYGAISWRAGWEAAFEAVRATDRPS